ncbi:hypothetical protein M8C21_016039 [Ambrosia artemisiifolia]|uniref:Uncharacterized protein n=1 Tax=Ambrosia artemisiifolia TaxID=4212 RepID=A0AAD5BS42_AMBAR|nr:hypothetical protein M8C21_016039 [Ambrosia artemisiifolia]
METELIEEIVNDLNSRLGAPLKSATLPQLIGVTYHIEHITSWLKDGSSYTGDILTILGMGGIGKTSLANYVYELHRREYTCSFVGDISRRCAGKYLGLLDVQKQLCDDISKASSIQVHDVYVYTSMIENALAHKKVFVVLDDVDSLDQLDALLGNKALHNGSKIIITTKDASLIDRCALMKRKVKPKHTKCTLEGLSMNASLELFCHHAFMCNYPGEGYEEVSIKIVRYCDGHPLALEVLGKSLHKRDIPYWEEHIKGLQKEPLSGIEKAKRALQLSYNSLSSENDKELFKHIACFFVGMDKDLTETILKTCDINTRSGITNLIEKCFLRVRWNNELMMHSLIQEMGRDLVRQESPNKPWKRSRLWQWIIFPQSSFEIDGMVKIEPMAGVTEKVLHSLGWTSIEFTKEMLLQTHDIYKGSDKSQSQMYYEFGIFSTIYMGKEMPQWISLLSHWMFGPNEMKGGDHITITVEPVEFGKYIKECGIGLVYDDEIIQEEEDALGYYKSWNYIIGRDLSPFQLTTGAYVLNNDGFLAYASKSNACYHQFFDYGAYYKEEGRVAFKNAFKAFS